MNQRINLIIIIIMLFFLAAPKSGSYSQRIPLKPLRHGMDLIYGNKITKNEILDDVRFVDGKHQELDVLRFDILGKAISFEGPLIVSSIEPIQVDSLGLIPLAIHPDSLRKLMILIQALDTKVKDRSGLNFIFRVTYRLSGQVFQYYVIGPEVATVFFKRIERYFLSYGDREVTRRFYRFITPSELMIRSMDGPKWKYE